METKVFGDITVTRMSMQEYEADQKKEPARARKLLFDYLDKIANDPGRLAGLVRRTLQATTELLMETERDIPTYQANPQLHDILVRACAQREHLEEDWTFLQALEYLLRQNLLQAVAADFRKYLVDKLTF